MPAKTIEERRWYRRAHWQRLRAMVLQRDPICQYCGRRPSTCVDHKIPHRGDYAKFCDPDNLAGSCKPCHDKKTATEDGAFGHTPKPHVGPQLAPIGEPGKHFQACAVPTSDDALADGLADLLKDL